MTDKSGSSMVNILSTSGPMLHWFSSAVLRAWPSAHFGTFFLGLSSSSVSVAELRSSRPDKDSIELIERCRTYHNCPLSEEAVEAARDGQG